MSEWLEMAQSLASQYPWLRTIWDAAIVVLPLSCLLAYTGIYFLSSTAKILSVMKKRSAFDKCARQLAILGLILGWSLLIGGRLWLYCTQTERTPGTMLYFTHELGWMLLSLGVLLSSVYFTLWRILRNMPVLHTTVGMICAVQNCLALACILFTIRIAAAASHPGAASLPDLFPGAWNSPVWSAAAYTLPLIFAMPGAFGSCWLILRRGHDDYGRDYYNTMLPWCAAWARNAWVVLWLGLLAASSLQIWTGWNSGTFNEKEALFEGGRLALWLLPLLLWTVARGASAPLRHKWAFWLALPIAACFSLPYFIDISRM